MEDPQKNQGQGKMGTDPKVDIQDNRPRSPINGQPLPGGRKKGQVNKLTRTFKAAAEEAFERGGGVDWLVKLMHGTASDRAAVLGLYGRLIPHQLVGKVDHAVKVELSWLGGRNIGKTVVDMDSPDDAKKQIDNQDVTDVTPNIKADVRQPDDQKAGEEPSNHKGKP